MNKYFKLNIKKTVYRWEWSRETLYIDFELTFKLFAIQYFKKWTYRPDKL